jgi:hypothetical protein
LQRHFGKCILKQGELGGGSGSGMRGLIHSAMNNGNSHNYNHEFAMPSSSNMTGTFNHGTFCALSPVSPSL